MNINYINQHSFNEARLQQTIFAGSEVFVITVFGFALE